MLRTLIILLCFSLSISQLLSQEHWVKISQTEGLLSNIVLDIEVENDNKWWIASDIGISLIENQNHITNWTISGFNILQDRIIDLEYTQNKLWIATTNGLYNFDGSSFQFFGISSGFSDLSITALSSQSNGNLWIGTENSTSMYDGQSFTHHDSIRAKFLFVDGNDLVYAFRDAVIAPSLKRTRVFELGRWVNFTTLNNEILVGDNVHESGGEIYLTVRRNANGKSGYWKLKYPNQNEFQALDINGINIQLEEFVKRDSLILGSSSFNIYMSLDSSLHSIPGIESYSCESIAITKDRMLIGTYNGLIYSLIKGLRKTILDSLATNKIISSISENGEAFSSSYQFGLGGFGFPKENPIYHANGADFTFAALKSPNLYVSTEYPGYNNIFGPANKAFALKKPYFIKITQEEIKFHKDHFNTPGYQISRSIKDWPAIGDSTIEIAPDLAPFADVNQNGCYDPQNGDYPIIKGDEAIYWIKHSTDPNLNLEFHYMMYAYLGSNKSELSQCQFLQYRIINRGPDKLDSCKAGFFFNGDIGFPTDDYFGCDSANSISYFYNADSSDMSYTNNNGSIDNIPAVGVKFLSDSMTNHIYFQAFGGQTNPVLPIHYWNLMNSISTNGRRLVYGGIPEDSVLGQIKYTNFMFTGNPSNNTGWTARRTWPGKSPSSPGDRNTVSSFAPFKLGIGESKTFELVMAYGRKDSVQSHFENVAELKRVLAVAGVHWDSLASPTFIYGQKDDCPQAIGINENNDESNKLLIYPNPTKGFLNIESDKQIEQIQIYSGNGRLVYDQVHSNYFLKIQLDELQKGLYILRIRDIDGKWENEKLLLD